MRTRLSLSGTPLTVVGVVPFAAKVKGEVGIACVVVLRMGTFEVLAGNGLPTAIPLELLVAGIDCSPLFPSALNDVGEVGDGIDGSDIFYWPLL